MMKKTLVALAAVAATASFAQSSVTITGALATALNQNVATVGGVSTTTTGFFNNPTGTSSVIFTGAEDLGGGMKGLFLYEIDPNANLKNAVGLSGEVFVGLSGGWGSLKLGTPNQPTLTVSASRNPFGTKTGGGYGSVQGAALVRMNSSLRYDSPDFGGFKVAFGFAPEVPAAAVAAAGTPATLTNTLTGGAAQTDLSLNYNNGPLNAGISFASQAEVAVGNALNPAGVAGLKQTNLYANYGFGALRAFFGAHTQDNTTAAGVGTSSNGQNIGLRYDFANMAVMANLAVLRNAAANTDARIWGLGFDYNLSKRTAAVVRINQLTQDSPLAATAAENRNMMAGLIHKF